MRLPFPCPPGKDSESTLLVINPALDHMGRKGSANLPVSVLWREGEERKHEYALAAALDESVITGDLQVQEISR